MSSRRHRSRERRLRLKERVQRRYRIGQWRRIVVGLCVLVGVGLVIAGAGWGGVYLFVHMQSAEARQDGPGPALADGKPLTEPRLIGAWQSDADANIAEMRRTRVVTSEEEQQVRRHGFKSKVTYTDKMMVTDVDGVVEPQPYQVVSQDGDVVIIKTWLDIRRQEEEVRIRFVGPDTYWFEFNADPIHVSECFRRVR
jgi:hypothetical protein